MGRHSRKGPAPSVTGTGPTPAADGGRVPPAEGGRPSAAEGGRPSAAGAGRTPPAGAQTGTGRRRRAPEGPGERGTTRGQGTLHGYGTPAHGTPAHGTPAHGTLAHGAPGRRSQGPPGGQGSPAYDTPAHGVPHTPAHGVPVRGGHPVHEEAGRPGPERYGPATATGTLPVVPGPRRSPAAGTPAPPAAPSPAPVAGGGDGAGRSGKGKAFTGIAAAAVTTCLAIVVAGQVADREEGAQAARAAQQPAERASQDASASRSDERAAPSSPPPATRAPAPTYEQLMTRQFPIDPKLAGSGDFETVPGTDRAPGRGQKHRYRIDVEKGLGLDAGLFARAVQRTLNDKRSWAGEGAMTFERISSGEADFVITLASPVTTGKWCAKSGLDTTVDNVSCDSASTERVMINAFRWAKGSETFGPKAMHAYRQMLINHEVGHRLGHNHVSCRTPGALAPVMQQQTKSLDIDGIVCRPNPWVHPGS
ncbi:DUF3152 domain-containing protein [Streptomyces griseus]|uniref:DUF3152 domain-containing protein n=1 Tax=Streptomyces griseus TaxID=1911 RepID=UPI0004C8A8CF|nr:DUF3152 domain-containing protein [Streptomyces griseus]